MSFKRISGTKDILPEEALAWKVIEDTAKSIFSAYNYSEIRTPIIEEASLFNRSLGETAEIVQKQMFLIKHGDDLYALRPEGTASLVRAYLENNLDKTTGFAKFYYVGPMFRAERPQKGRFRQFHHIGCEVIGSSSPAVDVEVISLAESLLKATGIEDYKIKLNTLGCGKDKSVFIDYLREELKDELSGLCPDCKVRFKKNILRVLDCKNEACIAIARKLSLKHQHLCHACAEHFSQVMEGLDSLSIGYEPTPHLARGLDYYTGTVFEISHPELGAQDALGAGGRYDNLVQDLGGPKTAAIGFALGVERLLLATSSQQPAASQKLVYVIALGDAAKKESVKLL
ncbi:MAG: histidine--tRNA ligase, partial [Candidatus Omnitrophota bacterium]